MSKITETTDLIKEAGVVADELLESKEERQSQLSHRHQMDMINGTWLTKNIRPMTLLLLLFYWIVLMPILLTFGVSIDASVINAVEMLSLAAFTFYFGSKGFEKVQVIKARDDRKRNRRAIKAAKKLRKVSGQ